MQADDSVRERLAEASRITLQAEEGEGLPEVTGAAVWVVAAVAAIGVGLGAASILGAVRGAHIDDTPSGSHRFARVLVGLGYFALAALIIFAVVNANR